MKKILFKMILLLVLLSCIISCRDTIEDNQETGWVVYYDSALASIYMIKSDGTDKTELSPVYPALGAPALYNTYARRAEYVVYAANTSIAMTDLSSISNSTLTTVSALNTVRVSPDQQKIGYGDNGDINVLFLSGGTNNFGTMSGIYDFDWSRDSKKVACTMYNSETLTTDLYLINVDGSGSEVLVQEANSTSPGYPKWSPKGDRMLFLHDLDGDAVISYYSIKLDGTDLISYSSSGMDPSNGCWSPDAKRIAFMDENTNYIYVVDADGSEAPKLIFSDYLASSVTWSTYGEWLLIDAYNGTDYDVFCVDPETGDYFTAVGGSGDQRYSIWLVD